jgi:hypothetical protein
MPPVLTFTLQLSGQNLATKTHNSSLVFSLPRALRALRAPRGSDLTRQPDLAINLLMLESAAGLWLSR